MKYSQLNARIWYGAVAVLCLLFSLAAGWNPYATRLNHDFYDLYFRQRGTRPPGGGIVIVAIDDATLSRYGALPLNRTVLAGAIRAIQSARPRVLAIDLLLTDVTTDEADRELALAIAEEPRPVLSTAQEARYGGKWLSPLPPFSAVAAAVGHVHAEPDDDGVSRQVLLEKQAARERYWAIAMECFRIAMGEPQKPVTETADALQVEGYGNHRASVPASRRSQRAILINYAGTNGTFPYMSLPSVIDDPSQANSLRDKLVFIGVTAQGTGDRLFTPFSSGVGMPGVEIHANILHTLLSGEYLRRADDLTQAVAILAIAAATAAALLAFHGPLLIAVLLAIAACVIGGPYWLFLKGQVWPAFSILLAYGVTLLVCGTYQLLFTRRRFAESEARRRRTQQQFEMATHEIRTPLTAIQASSELLSHYQLDDAKRKQMLDVIYDESQRLGKLVERFLSVERLSAGEMQLKRIPVELSAALNTTIQRLTTAAERKRISVIRDDKGAEVEIEGDPELIEFAISNLVNNAVKYSPAGTSVRVALEYDAGHARIHVSDSGPGMNREESRKVFDRFYRTRSAENSSTTGFGLGLAIAREIARHHGGDLQLETSHGSGSRFTIVLPVVATAASKQPSRKF